MEYRYPALEAYLNDRTVVQSWTVDDVVRSLKKIEDGLRKVEITMAKDKSWMQRADEKKQLADVQALLKKLTEQLNRLLGVSV